MPQQFSRIKADFEQFTASFLVGEKIKKAASPVSASPRTSSTPEPVVSSTPISSSPSTPSTTLPVLSPTSAPPISSSPSTTLPVLSPTSAPPISSSSSTTLPVLSPTSTPGPATGSASGLSPTPSLSSKPVISVSSSTPVEIRALLAGSNVRLAGDLPVSVLDPLLRDPSSAGHDTQSLPSNNDKNANTTPSFDTAPPNNTQRAHGLHDVTYDGQVIPFGPWEPVPVMGADSDMSSGLTVVGKQPKRGAAVLDDDGPQTKRQRKNAKVKPYAIGKENVDPNPSTAPGWIYVAEFTPADAYSSSLDQRVILPKETKRTRRNVRR